MCVQRAFFDLVPHESVKCLQLDLFERSGTKNICSKDRIREEKYLGKYGIRKRYIALDIGLILKYHEKKASYGNLFLG